MANFFSKLLSLGADKDLKRFQRMAADISALAPTYEAMSSDELKSQSAVFKERVAKGESLDDILPEAFAVCREMSGRILGMRHFDVQLIGGIALHEGMIAEMKTGEGKTLVATLAAYLNALSGKGVHVVTVNDYLARRDSEWMGQLYRALGLEVGLLQNEMPSADKQAAYRADITYGTNTVFGFDYLRDNMATRVEDRLQRGHNYAIVDEVDSILIDEARTPLIISGAGTRSSDTYKKFARAVKGLREGFDFDMDEAKHQITATESGLRKVETMVGIDNIYDDMSGQLANHLSQALRAQFLYRRDKDYVVQDGEVKIVDEFTGRIMEGRRWSEGLHQAVEAKEGVQIREENQTMATITLQNYFRLYNKLSGMTGTALTEDAEFREIYKLPVQPIPPNKPVIRDDRIDLIYRTQQSKFEAVVEDVIERHAKGQPVLVGTVSIENSERLSRMLDKRGIKHEVLNAKHHEREATIVAQAGRFGAVTIATNMAGRGTDILLGGNASELASEILLKEGILPEEATEEDTARAQAQAKEICAEEKQAVLTLGGLAIIGTERHESRRIDNQLRGRAGRQGDPGCTQFYLSLEDDIMRLFGGDKMEAVSSLMQRINIPDDMPIQAKLVSRTVESSQRRVEDMNFAARKQVLEYDDVMNRQRQTIYNERDRILEGKDLSEHVDEVIQDVAYSACARFMPEHASAEELDTEGLLTWLSDLTGEAEPDLDLLEGTELSELSTLEAGDAVYRHITQAYQSKAQTLGSLMKLFERQVMLRVIDTRWINYLQDMDYLKAGIFLRGYGQRDPLVEYKEEAYRAFGDLVETMYENYMRTILRIEVNTNRPAPVMAPAPAPAGMTFSGPAEVDGDRGNRARQGRRRPMGMPGAAAGAAGRPGAPGGEEAPAVRTYVKAEHDPYASVGRNDPCPCGSGKKFKNCHGRNLS